MHPILFSFPIPADHNFTRLNVCPDQTRLRRAISLCVVSAKGEGVGSGAPLTEKGSDGAHLIREIDYHTIDHGARPHLGRPRLGFAAACAGRSPVVPPSHFKMTATWPSMFRGIKGRWCHHRLGKVDEGRRVGLKILPIALWTTWWSHSGPLTRLRSRQRHAGTLEDASELSVDRGTKAGRPL